MYKTLIFYMSKLSGSVEKLELYQRLEESRSMYVSRARSAFSQH